MLVWNVGLVGTTEALSGFSNAGMLAVGALFVVIKGVEKSQIADKAARQVFGLRTSLSAGLARLMSLCFVLSAFLNNTPVVALLIPITRDWARARGFSPSTFLIPLSYSCIMGGLLTVIGTSTNLVVQGLVLVEAKTDPTIERIGFFEPGYVGVPLGVLGMAYLVVFAPRVLPSCGGLFRYVRDRAKELLTEVCIHVYIVCTRCVVLLRGTGASMTQEMGGRNALCRSISTKPLRIGVYFFVTPLCPEWNTHTQGPDVSGKSGMTGDHSK